MLLLYFLTYLSRIVTEKPHQGSVNKLLYCIALWKMWRLPTTVEQFHLSYGCLKQSSLFFLSPLRETRETRKWPSGRLKERDGRGTENESLAAKPERVVFHGLLIFWRENWNLINRIQYWKRVHEPST